MPEGARPEAGVVEGAVAAGTRRVDAPGLVAVALATAAAGRHAGALALGAVAAGRRAAAPGPVVPVAVVAAAGRHAGVLAPVAVAGAYAGALVPAAVGAVVGLAVAPALDGRGALCLLEHAVQTPAAHVMARVTNSAARTVAPGVVAPQGQPALSAGVLADGARYPLAVAGALSLEPAGEVECLGVPAS